VRADALFWVLVLGFAAGGERTLAALRRCYERVSGETLAPSSFYKRFTPALARFLKRAFEEAVSQVQQAHPALRGVLQQFLDVLLVDSSVIRLRDHLARVFPACRTNHTQAAAKLHMVMSVEGAGPSRVKITPERVHDRRVLRVGRWVRGKLLLFDLGYFCYALFARVAQEGGYFLTRLKGNANPEIIGTLRSHHGQAIPLAGCRLGEVERRLRRQILDVEVEVRYRKRAYGGIRRQATMRLRLVGIWDLGTRLYHFFLTNIPVEVLSAEEIGRLYGLRWQVELLFREMKNAYCLEDIPSGKESVARSLLYATLLTVVVSRALLHAVQQRLHPQDEQIPTERWARLFVSSIPELLIVVLDQLWHARHRERLLWRFLLKEAPDPNRSRQLLLVWVPEILAGRFRKFWPPEATGSGAWRA
jgi:IS4 transposase